MTNSDDVIVIVTERFERRLSDETGKLRADMATEFGKVRAETAAEFGRLRAETAVEFGKVRTETAIEFGRVRAEMATGFGSLRTEIAQLRAEMIERNGDLLKWILIFGVTQTAATVGLIKLWR